MITVTNNLCPGGNKANHLEREVAVYYEGSSRIPERILDFAGAGKRRGRVWRKR
jgi:hypothetical protein